MDKEMQIYQILMPKLLPSVHNSEQFVMLLCLQASKLVCIVSWTDWRHETPSSETKGAVPHSRSGNQSFMIALVPPVSPFTKSEGLHYKRGILDYGGHHCQ